MELFVGVTAAQSALFGYVLGAPSSKSEAIKDERLLRIFNEMKSRMGIDEDQVSLMENNAVPLAVSKGTLFCGMKGQIIVNSPEIFDKQDDEQVAAIFAHELSHLYNYDQIRLPVFWFAAQVTVGIALMVIYSWPLMPAYGVAFLVSTIAALCVFFPRIEFQADQSAAKVLTDHELERYIDYHENQLALLIQKRNRSGASFCDWLSISSDGNRRFDFLHPERTRVVSMLKLELAVRKVCALPA